MCCLFGIIDYRGSLSVKHKNRMLLALATAAEERGTDATGIAYNAGGKLRIYKRPVPGHWMRFQVPGEARVIMGHTRMTTQGVPSRNRNNHPFEGCAGGQRFALAHNGVIWNDDILRRGLGLPQSKIETDSYIAVQLLERQKALDFASLRYMAEQVKGSFTFTVLDQRDSLYIVKGDNPLCLYYFPVLGLYLYASTEEILRKAISKFCLPKPVREKLSCGDILRIDVDGTTERSQFDISELLYWSNPLWKPYTWGEQRQGGISELTAPDSYLAEVKSVASAFGYTPEAIDRLAAMGFSAEELEEFLYCGEL